MTSYRASRAAHSLTARRSGAWPSKLRACRRLQGRVCPLPGLVQLLGVTNTPRLVALPAPSGWRLSSPPTSMSIGSGPAPLTETPVRVLGRPDGPGRCPVSRALVPSARSPLAREGAYRGSWASGRGHPRGRAVAVVFTRTRAAGTRCRGRSGVSQTKRPSRRRGEARRAGARRGHGEDGEASGRVARAEDPQRGNARRSGQAHREAREPL